MGTDAMMVTEDMVMSKRQKGAHFLITVVLHAKKEKIHWRIC